MGHLPTILMNSKMCGIEGDGRTISIVNMDNYRTQKLVQINEMKSSTASSMWTNNFHKYRDRKKGITDISIKTKRTEITTYRKAYYE